MVLVSFFFLCYFVGTFFFLVSLDLQRDGTFEYDWNECHLQTEKTEKKQKKNCVGEKGNQAYGDEQMERIWKFRRDLYLEEGLIFFFT